MDRPLLSRARSFAARKEGRKFERTRGREKSEGARTETEASDEGRGRNPSRSCGWTIRVLGSRRWYGGMVQRLPAASVVGGRTVARWEKRQSRRGGTENAVGIPMNHRWNGRTRRVEGGTSLVAAITVSGRHALLVGYQPDEALRPSLATLFLSLFPSLPMFPVFLSLALFRNLLVSRRCKPRNGSLSTELYTYTRASLCARPSWWAPGKI